MSTPKIILVTGANTGLGFEILKSLCRSQTTYTILVGCRTVSKGEDAIDSIHQEFPSTASTLRVLEVDLGSDTSLEKATEIIQKDHGKLDILVNNGGANYDRQIQSKTLSVRDAFNKSWDTNVSGTHVLTLLIMPLLLKSSDPRLVFMTSGTASVAETESLGPTATEALKRINASPPAGWPKEDVVNPITAYRSSKVGLNMLMREWFRITRNDGVKTWAVSPGFLATGLGQFTVEQLKKMGALDPSVGADFTVDVIEGKRDGDVGKAIRRDMIQPW